MPSQCAASPSTRGGRSDSFSICTDSAVVPSSEGIHSRQMLCARLCKIPRGSIRAAPHLGPWRKQYISATWGRLRSRCQQAISRARRPWSWEPSRQIRHRGCDLKQQREVQGTSKLIFVLRQLIRSKSAAKRRLIARDLSVKTTWKYGHLRRWSHGALTSL